MVFEESLYEFVSDAIEIFWRKHAEQLGERELGTAAVEVRKRIEKLLPPDKRNLLELHEDTWQESMVRRQISAFFAGAILAFCFLNPALESMFHKSGKEVLEEVLAEIRQVEGN